MRESEMKTQLNQTISKQFKSPKTKLIRFFEKSRDKWKERAKESKYKIKLLNKKIKYLEDAASARKERINQLESEVEQMMDKEKQMQEELEQIKKKVY